MKRALTVVLSAILALVATFTVGCFNKDGKNVSLRYYNTAGDLMPMLIAGTESIGLLPEPAATNLEKSTESKGMTWYRLNVQELYDSEKASFPQAVIMAKSSLVKAHPELVTAISNSLDNGVEWAKNNVSEAQNVIKSKFGETTTVANMNKNAVENSNIYFESAQEVKQSVKDYLNKIIEISPQGAKQVDDDFFYTVSEQSGAYSDTISVYAPDGAPSLAIAKYIYDNENFGLDKTFNYNVVVANTLAASGGDIVIMPVNLASKIYKNNAQNPYVCLGVVTHGNLYLMSKSPINKNDLKDKTIGVISQGQVPDWTLQMALKNNGYTFSEVN